MLKQGARETRNAHLLSQGPGTDGTWLWVQPSSRLVLGLDQTTQFEIKPQNELGKNVRAL